MNFKAEKKYFVKDGKPYFLISGEIHYFRLNPRLWKKHLTLLKQAGANTASTYIPWDWHEYEEGKFDFTGQTNPARNLIKFIKLCKISGLNLIVKPGPYILAEYKNHGLPDWFLKKCSKKAYALDENGDIISPDLMSYMSEEFLNHAFLWYDKIMPVIALHQESNGGPIIMMQVCNEIGVFQWLYGRIDYNDLVIKLYKEFISEKYKSIEKLNSVYGTQYFSFKEINPPAGKIENKQQYCAYFDFHLFYRHYYALYLDTLIKKIKTFGMDIQLFHNIPGWIYGDASELPMLITTYEEIMRTRTDIVFGLDHIPEFFSFRNAHSDLACNKILEALQTYAPVWAAEFQCGSREHQVKSYAKDMESFYFASLAHGLKGINYYVFAQGINPQSKGYYSRMFYYQTAVNSGTKKTQMYQSVKKVNSFILKQKEELVLSESRADICVGLYKPYFYTELTNSQMLKEKKLEVTKLGLTYDPKIIRGEILFNGLLRGLQTLNFNYDIRDLESSSVQQLIKYKQLWVVTTELMDSATQKLLVDYIKSGGHLIIYPTIPTKDLYLNKCSVLKDELSLCFSESLSPNKVKALAIENLFTNFKEKLVFDVEEKFVIAKSENEESVGIHLKVGDGFLTALGFAFGYSTDEHLILIEKIISLNKLKREAEVSDPDVQFVIRRSGKSFYLFLINYHNEEKRFTANSKNYLLKPFSVKIIKQKKY